MTLIILLVILAICLEKPIIGWIVKSLAEKNLGFTNLRTGQYKAIQTIGDKDQNGKSIGGEFKHFIGYAERLDKDGKNYFVAPDPGNSNIITIVPDPYVYLSRFNKYIAKNYGSAWIGWPTIYEVAKYHLVRYKTALTKDDAITTTFKDEWVDSVYDTAPYTVLINKLPVKGFVDEKSEDVELKKRQAENIILTKVGIEFILRIFNPYTNLYGIIPVGNWSNQFGAKATEAIRNFGSKNDFETLTHQRGLMATPESKDESTLWQKLSEIERDLKKFCGAEIVQINFVEFADASEEVAKSRHAIDIARLKGMALVEAAEYQGKANEAIGKSLKKKYEEIIASKGGLLYIWEKISESVNPIGGQVLNLVSPKKGKPDKSAFDLESLLMGESEEDSKEAKKDEHAPKKEAAHAEEHH